MRCLLFCLLLSACGFVDYDATEPGKFTGSLLVMWVGEGGESGDGKFVYVPSRNRPLTFTRPDPDATPRVIRPEMMYTDGGSIPRQAQLFSGFSPWGYAPAYMVHDWLFVARRCLNDGIPTAEERRIRSMTFSDSADLIAEAIKALIVSGRVKPREVAPRVISGTVAGPVSYQRWIARGECRKHDRVSQKHRDEVKAALDREAGIMSAERTRARPARIVAEIEF